MNNRRNTLRILGNILLIAGISVWGVYALMRFGIGKDVTPLQFLPYHLAGVISGAILKRYQFFYGIFKRLLSCLIKTNRS